MSSYLNNLAFVVYPYVCLAVFLMGSLARFDRDQYTWKSDSSQMLRTGTLRWGSNLFHVGILFLFFGHLFGQLTPHWLYDPFISAPQKQLVAIVAGGVAGLICFVGLTLLLHRRIFDPRIRLTSHRTDLAILVILWVQLSLGLITLPLSWEHRHDASDRHEYSPTEPHGRDLLSPCAEVCRGPRDAEHLGRLADSDRHSAHALASGSVVHFIALGLCSVIFWRRSFA